MKTRIVLAFILILGLTLLVKADWITFHVGRVDVQEWVTGNDMMSYASSAGAAYVNADEKVSRLVEERCQEYPGECASLGIRVRPAN